MIEVNFCEDTMSRTATLVSISRKAESVPVTCSLLLRIIVANIDTPSDLSRAKPLYPPLSQTLLGLPRFHATPNTFSVVAAV